MLHQLKHEKNPHVKQENLNSRNYTHLNTRNTRIIHWNTRLLNSGNTRTPLHGAPEGLLLLKRLNLFILSGCSFTFAFTSCSHLSASSSFHHIVLPILTPTLETHLASILTPASPHLFLYIASSSSIV